MVAQPNILQITTHDSGRHFGCYGHRTLNTPHIDALGADGVQFDKYFCVAPICCASRASMLTGRYPQSHGLMDLCFPPFDWALHEDELHITHYLREAGYRNLLFGTQHEVADHDLKHLAFDEVRQSNSIIGRFMPCEVVAGETAAFLSSPAARAQPFYAQVGFLETHTPFSFGGVEPDETKGVEIPPYLADDTLSRKAMAHYQGSVHKVDQAVGVILDALRRSGLEQNTLVVFTTDHGIEMPRAKWHLYDPGIAIALILRSPSLGLVGGGRVSQLLSNVDYLPSILELAGLPISKRVQGRSFAAALKTENAPAVRDAIFGMYYKDHTRCVRTNRFKLIRHFDSPLDYSPPVRIEHLLMKRAPGKVELFDLVKDSNEFTNLADRPECASIQQELDAKLWQWMEEVDDPLLSGPVRSPTYESALRDYAHWKANH